jgi:cell division protease FtsH
VVLLGGRAAERHCTGVTTTGAADDLSRASQLASDMVTRYGMSGALGPRTLGPEAAAFSPELAGRADAATGALLGEAEAAAAAAVAANEAALRALAERLLVEETVGGDELTAALAGAALPAHAQRWVDSGETGDEV